MDSVTAQIADFATSMTFDDLPSEVVNAACVRWADSIACALGGLASPPVRAASRVAAGVGTSGFGGAQVIGWPVDERVPVDLAAFLNTSMIRYLDFNDWTPNGHPSDCLGPLLAAASGGESGRDLVAAAVVAYEVMIGLTSRAKLAAKGWDQGFAVGVGTVAGLGALLKLDRDTVANAIGIIAASGVPVAATRSGELSMWKASATAYFARNAVFATQLAREGMTGPLAAFDGRRGIKQVVSGPFDLELGINGFQLPGTSLKYWPVCYHAQAAAWAAHRLRADVDPASVDSIVVDTYREAWRSTGSEREKWRPASRETADHSTPWVVARMLCDGVIDARSFTDDKFADAEVMAVMAKIVVNADEEATDRFPRDVVTRVTAIDKRGRTHVAEVTNPSGHPRNPMSANDLDSKFAQLAAEARIPPADAKSAAALWMRLDDQRSVQQAMTVVVPPEAGDDA